MSDKVKPGWLQEEDMLKELSPFGGYAYGNYVPLCRTCKRQFSGDKRAFQCLYCAVHQRLSENTDD